MLSCFIAGAVCQCFINRNSRTGSASLFARLKGLDVFAKKNAAQTHTVIFFHVSRLLLDVSESQMPERQCVWRTWVLGQVQWSRGEYNTTQFKVVIYNFRFTWYPLVAQLRTVPTQFTYLFNALCLLLRGLSGHYLLKMPNTQWVGSHNHAWLINHSGCWKVQSIRYNGFIYVQL